MLGGGGGGGGDFVQKNEGKIVKWSIPRILEDSESEGNIGWGGGGRVKWADYPPQFDPCEVQRVIKL